MDDESQTAERPVANRLLLAAVLSVVGIGAVAMLVLAAASVVFR